MGTEEYAERLQYTLDMGATATLLSTLMGSKALAPQVDPRCLDIFQTFLRGMLDCIDPDESLRHALGEVAR